MLPWKLRKRQILPVNQNISSVYFSLAKFQLVSWNLSLAMIWQMTYTHKLPKLCSATLSNDDGDGSENGKNPIGLDSPNNIFARASRFFEHYLAVVARLQRESA